LMKSDEERKCLLLKCAPDMPETSSVSREQSNPNAIISTTDIILPELCLDGLQAGKGRCLILLLTRRLASPDIGLKTDLKLLNSQFERKVLPSFSGGAFDSLNTPFVDMFDESESIQSISADASEDIKSQVKTYLKEGRIVHGEVFLACSVRRNALADFILALKDEFDTFAQEQEQDQSSSAAEVADNNGNEEQIGVDGVNNDDGEEAVEDVIF
jgi:hypothetical protein